MYSRVHDETDRNLTSVLSLQATFMPREMGCVKRMEGGVPTVWLLGYMQVLKSFTALLE